MLRGSIRPVKTEMGSNQQGGPPSPKGAKISEPKLHHCGCVCSKCTRTEAGGSPDGGQRKLIEKHSTRMSRLFI